MAPRCWGDAWDVVGRSVRRGNLFPVQVRGSGINVGRGARDGRTSRAGERCRSDAVRARAAHENGGGAGCRRPDLAGIPRRFSPCADLSACATLAARPASQRHPPWRTHAEQDAGEETGEESAEGRRRRQGERTPEAAAAVGRAGRGGRRPPAPLPRSEAVSKVWDYIKAHNLQNPENRREILADDTLREVFGKDRVTMFEMNKHLARHLK
jgi:hypothetical protein